MVAADWGQVTAAGDGARETGSDAPASKCSPLLQSPFHLFRKPICEISSLVVIEEFEMRILLVISVVVMPIDNPRVSVSVKREARVAIPAMEEADPVRWPVGVVAPDHGVACL